MMDFIDNFLNRITMYRLILYYLIALILIAVIFGLINLVPYSPVVIIYSTLLLVVVAWITNFVFASVFNAPTNVESVFITALILALIISPVKSFGDSLFLVWAAVLAMASKYILAIKNKHIFNPVAIAVVLTAFGFNQSASWWAGNLAMTPFVVLGGLLIVRKIRREDMIFSFVFTALLTIFVFTLMKGGDLFSVLKVSLFHSSLFFFAFVMLTEPLTTPPTNTLQIIYGALVGALFAPQVHFGSLYSTPELALVAGNIFSYIVGPKDKLILRLNEKIQIAPDTIDFIFPLEKKISFAPGQYMEWTLPHTHVDDRGNRRYFTLASSPTEDTLRIGVKFYQQGSSYKQSLQSMNEQSVIVAGQRAGDFILPKNPQKKCVFMAGGIGITPYRSILKYLLDTHEKWDIVFMYSNKNASEIVYQDILEQAQKELNTKIIYTLTDINAIPSGWLGKTGRFNEVMIQQEIPDYQERLFYLSGPHAMVQGFKATLKNLGVKNDHIKTDFFPGFV